MTSAFRWFKYVRHADREQAEAEGWIFSADLGHPHGHFSILMEMPMASAPRIPPSPVPSPAERFEEAVATLDRAKQSGIAGNIVFARLELFNVAYNLAHAIVAGLRLLETAPP